MSKRQYYMFVCGVLCHAVMIGYCVALLEDAMPNRSKTKKSK